MTQIDSRDRLAAVIRQQVSSLAKAAGSTNAARPALQSPAGQQRQPAAGSSDVAALVSQRVRAIDPDDPNRHRKAFRVFLESVLLAELGENLINDAGFHQLVDDVHAQMNADADLASAVHSAAEMMLTAPTQAPAAPFAKGT